jgi:hypothetical protein
LQAKRDAALQAEIAEKKARAEAVLAARQKKAELKEFIGIQKKLQHRAELVALDEAFQRGLEAAKKPFDHEAAAKRALAEGNVHIVIKEHHK